VVEAADARGAVVGWSIIIDEGRITMSGRFRVCPFDAGTSQAERHPMLIETLHSLMIAGFVAVWLLVGYVTMREMARQRKTSGLDSHRFDATHAPAPPSPRARPDHADRHTAAAGSHR
jgi:hypothetical protein